MPYKNKADQAAAAKRHYQNNKTKLVERAMAHNEIAREAIRRLIREHLQINTCVDCPETDIVVMEFDHRDPSTKLFCERGYRHRG